MIKGGWKCLKAILIFLTGGKGLVMSKFKNFIFDLDGTITDSSKEVLNCFEEAFRLVGHKIDKKRLTSNVIGPPLREILRLIAPDMREEKALTETERIFHKIYDFDEEDVTVLYDGIGEVLNKLKISEKNIFMATLKPKVPTER